MAYQVPITNRGLTYNRPDYDTGLHQQKNSLDILKSCKENQAILILIIILLVLLFNKANSDKKLHSVSMKQHRRKKLVMAKLLFPIGLPVLDSIYSMVRLRKDGLLFIERLSEQYGSLFEFPFGPVTLTAVSDPVIIQKLLSSTQLAHLNKPKIYKTLFGEIFHNGLVTSESEIWSAQRKMLARSFTYNSLQNFLAFMNTHAANLTNRLIHECENNNGSNIKLINQLLSAHIFKIIAQIVMGTDSLSPDESNEIAEYYNCFKDLTSERLLNPWKYLWLQPKRRKLNHILEIFNNFFVKMTQKYKKEYKQIKISSKLHHSGTDRDNEDEGVGVKPFRCMIEEMLCSGATDEEIYEQVGTILGTGHDTVTMSIKMLMLHLALNPDHQVACRAEVDKILNKNGSIHKTYNHTNVIQPFDLTMEDLHDLNYLGRCILESGRITSIVPIFMRRIDAPLKIDDDLEFPSGTNFAIFNWILHRDPKIYTDPLSFDPDRFLSENVKKRHPFSYTPFSLGPRNCIGSKVAMMEVKVMMVYILHHFEILSDDKLENVKLHFGITVVPERDYKIVLKRREQPNL